MGSMIRVQCKLRWWRLPRCLCTVFTLMMCPFQSRAVALMFVVFMLCVCCLGPVIEILHGLQRPKSSLCLSVVFPLTL